MSEPTYPTLHHKPHDLTTADPYLKATMLESSHQLAQEQLSQQQVQQNYLRSLPALRSIDDTMRAVSTDPNGLSQHTPGAKLDNGKSKTGLMVAGFANALASVAEVTTYGATKYTPNGWVSVPDGIDRYTDALYRHMLLSVHQEKDQESNLDHLAHACWNLLAIYELTLRQELSSDQFKI